MAEDRRGVACPMEQTRRSQGLGGLDRVLPTGRGAERTTDYQGAAYADLFRQRLQPFLQGDAGVAAEVARQLALWMTYEDIIRVADLKTRAARFERVRREVGARDGEPVIVIDYLKPARLDETIEVITRCGEMRSRHEDSPPRICEPKLLVISAW